MKERLYIRKIAWLVVIMVICHISAVQSQPLNERQQHNLNSLTTHFEPMGMDLAPLLEDEEFEIYENIAERFINSAESKSLDIHKYKNILQFEDKTQRIQQFIKEHLAHLRKAEQTYGIPKYVISAIIGIESNFGRYLGSYNPFNVYVSMYIVGYRQRFARAQLEELLKFTQKNNLDIWELNSSYAGAISFAQFISYSLNKWFVGEDIHSIENNIMSVANYLAYFKGKTGSLEKAVLRYNPSSLYNRAVMDLAKEAEKDFSAPGK